jgi:hypothetical protein
MIDIFGERPAEDILSRTVRLTLAGTEYTLPVLTIGGNRRWKASLDARLTGLLDGLEQAGDDPSSILGLLGSQTDSLVALLKEYDTTSVLPDAETIEETCYEDEVLTAVREVWRAANPFVERAVNAVVATIVEPPPSVSSPPTNSRPRRTGGSRKTSRKN